MSSSDLSPYHYQATVWQFVTADDAEVYETLTEDFIRKQIASDSNIERVYFQLESGLHGNLHWQMHFVLHNRIETNKTLKLKDWLWDLLNIHPKANRSCIYIKRANSPAASISYCQKERTRVEGPFLYNRQAETRFARERMIQGLDIAGYFQPIYKPVTPFQPRLKRI